MPFEFPYQLVAFLDAEPAIGEQVYNGTNGWYPQIALKRRFKAIDISEGELLARIETFCNNTPSFVIHTGDIIQPERMPVKILEVTPTPELIAFHTNFIAAMESSALSRYPDRDGINYLPHITAEYNGQIVIDTHSLSDKQFQINKVFLLKDVASEDSVAYAQFNLS